MINSAQHEFIKVMRTIDHSRASWEVFKDFCQLSASIFAIPFYQDAKEKFQEISDKYDDADIAKMDKMLSLMVEDLEAEYHDFLGEVFMELNLGSHWKGQFFTPWNVCRLKAKLVLDNVKKQLEKKLFISISDPCVGAGALLLAAAQEFREQNINYSDRVLFEAVDIDEVSFFMAYLQISLCGMAASVIHGDSLAMKKFRIWYTPVFFINNWTEKLKTQRIIDTMINLISLPVPKNEEKKTSRSSKRVDSIKNSEAVQFDLFSKMENNS